MRRRRTTPDGSQGLTSGSITTGPDAVQAARGAGRRPARGATRGGTARRGPGSVGVTAVVLATAPADGGGPAAGLPWEGATVLCRLLEQFASLGVRATHVVTRTAWAPALKPSVAGLGASVELHASPSPAHDLRLVADLAGAASGGLVIAYGDLVTHREALAGLLADPRVVSGILTTSGRPRRGALFRTRSSRGRVLSGASPFHAVGRPNGTFLGVLKVGPRDRAALADVARRLTALTDGRRPEGWDQELERKAEVWRESIARAALRRGDDAEPVDPDELDLAGVVLEPQDEAELRRRQAIAPEDVVALLLVGLVRAGVHLQNSYLRQLFWARPLNAEAAQLASEQIEGYDEDAVLLNSAVKASDGFFTTFFVSPYSKYLARFAARRGWTPNAISTVSLGIGLLAAIAFATGQRAGMVIGAVLLQIAFTTDCVDGQLARYTRTFSKLGAWLDSVFDRSKEYLVFAGLALGSTRGFGDDVWVLACCAITLQTARHAVDFAYGATQHGAMATQAQPPLEQPGDALTAARNALPVIPTTPEGGPSSAPPAPPSAPLPRRLVRAVARAWLGVSRAFEGWTPSRWLKRVALFPIGERFAVVSLLAALTTPRTTFVVVLAWGAFAGLYSLVGRGLRAFSR